MDSTPTLWKWRGHRFVVGLATGSSRLSLLIHEFERALRGTLPADALTLQAKIRAARNKLDLWDLRTDVHALVKQAFDKWEAQTRLDELESLFETPGPPSVLNPA